MDNTGVQGEEKKINSWIQSNILYTEVQIEGLRIWDGKSGSSKEQPKLLNTLKEEVDAIPSGDAFLRVECDIKVLAYNNESKLAYIQLATLSIRKIKNDYCGTVVNEQEIKEISKSPLLDLERLERDNIAVQDIQSKFEDSVNRKNVIISKVGSTRFNEDVLSFLKELPSVVSEKDTYGQDSNGCQAAASPYRLL